MSASKFKNQLSRPQTLTQSFARTLQSFQQSYLFSILLAFLGQRETIKMQQLSKFFYNNQIPRCMSLAKITCKKVRLHLFNHDYIVIFNIFQGTKMKKKIRGDIPHIWNCQSIEVNGVIYITGGSLANTKTYLNSAYKIDEKSWKLTQLANMKYQRDAHGIIEWRKGGGETFIIVIGSWHVEQNTKACEMYNILNDEWIVLPELNYATCAPGLIIIKDRYLYKLGGTTNIRKIEYIDLHESRRWITINTSNQMGKKQSINRCLLHPLWGARSKDDDHTFLILGCHFGRTESPFVYNVEKNKFSNFQKNDMQIDMYRSNDVVQMSEEAIFIRPFVKVGDPPENIKVLKYFLQLRVEKDNEDQVDGPLNNNNNKKQNIQPQLENQNRQSSVSLNQIQNQININQLVERQPTFKGKLGNLFKNVFSSKPKISTEAFIRHQKGQVEEVDFATTEWDNE